MNALVLAPIFAFTLACAAAAFALRPLIRSVLLLVGAWAGIAVFFLAAGAEFVAFAQFLIYVGAVSMVALFAVLLTRGGRAGEPEGVAAAAPAPAGRIGGAAAGLGVFAVLAAAIRATPRAAAARAPAALSVRNLGRELMGAQAPALLGVGVLLTAALIGAVVLAAGERGRR